MNRELSAECSEKIMLFGAFLFLFLFALFLQALCWLFLGALLCNESF